MWNLLSTAVATMWFPKEIDPWNKYDINEAQAYAEAHPEMEVVWSDDDKKYVPVINI